MSFSKEAKLSSGRNQTLQWVKTCRPRCQFHVLAPESRGGFPATQEMRAAKLHAARASCGEPPTRYRDGMSNDNGILASVAGEYVGAAQRSLPTAANATQDCMSVVADAGWAGVVRIHFRRYRYTHHRNTYLLVLVGAPRRSRAYRGG
jgi:hypothetical protein